MNVGQMAQLTPGFISIVVNAATGTGTGASIPFTIPPKASGVQCSVNFQCSGVYTVATLTLQQSFDGGTTFVNVGVAMDFYANKAGNLANINAVVAFTGGVIYQLSVTTFTGTSITIFLTVT